MNRAMLVTVLFRLDHGSVKPDNTISKTFKDVPANQWYTGSVEWAAENGIVAGTSASTFSPLDNITREQVASILYRYARYKGYDIDASIDLSGYKDSSSISSYAVKPISWASFIISGFLATTIRWYISSFKLVAAFRLMLYSGWPFTSISSLSSGPNRWLSPAARIIISILLLMAIHTPAGM